MRFRHLVVAALALTAGFGAYGVNVAAQTPLGMTSARGLTVTPAYEGWYPNPDGTLTLSFGYFNRNWEEALEIPIGPDNFIEPAEFNGTQPTRFEARRHWGVFGVTVPAGFPRDQPVTWTLKVRGAAFSIPGALKRDWKIDAREGEATTGNQPPWLSFSEGGPEGTGPGGITSEPMSARVGEALTLMVWARDDGLASGNVVRATRDDAPVKLTWFKFSGPGSVEFSEAEGEVPSMGGSMSTDVVFRDIGEYVLRIRANDASGVAAAGHSQCCWSNGYVHVTVKQ